VKPARARIERTFFGAAIALHLLTAWFSSGYYADDEHYQVIPFAEVEAGHEPESALPWEHAARIRSVVLPSVCLGVFAAAEAVGVHDPFHKAFLLRLLTALAALVIVRQWTRAAASFVPVHLQTAFLALSWLLWFLPYQHVRFTGETWSGLLLLAAITDLLTQEPARAQFLRSGLLIGLATLIRPPTAFMAMGMLGWVLFTKRGHLVKLIPLCASAILVHVLGAGLDSWWYGVPTYSPWNYVVEGASHGSGTLFDASPWWSYSPLLMKDLLIPIGLLTLAAYVMLWLKRPAGPLLWIITPFLLFHLLVPHKETRFLFPLADLVPLMLMLAFASLDTPWRIGFQRKALGVVLVVAVAANIVGLAVASFTPAGSGRTRLAEQLDAEVGRVVYDANANTVWKIAVPVFYGGPERPAERLRGLCVGGSQPVVSQEVLCSHVNVERVALADPPWADALLKAYQWRPQDRGWAVYRVTPR